MTAYEYNLEVGSSPLTRGKPTDIVNAARKARLIPAHAGKTRLATKRAARSTAHPRSRGENMASLLKKAPAIGSSPLTRGKPNSSRQRLVAAGLIPAHAGKTGWILICVSSGRAHPRSRGENHAAFLMYSYTVGSSPLTRGKPRVKAREVKRGRLIPAHAGKTERHGCLEGTGGAHPRSRGENAACSAATVPAVGSSPLTRGKLTPSPHAERSARLIPAHAGKTCHRRIERRPRCGSSPLTRGKPQVKLCLPLYQRLIPAHAGKTCSWSCPRARSRAHPRSRGENDLRLTFRARTVGLIPAHAGKTGFTTSGGALTRAHPRSRGENLRGRRCSSLVSGSSPLTRGKQIIPRLICDLSGLIPAHAGKTTSKVVFTFVSTAHPRSRGENCLRVPVVEGDAGSSPLTRGKHFLTCAFTAQIDQILETLELAASFGSYLIWVACATDAPQDPVRSIGLVLPSSMGAS